MWTLLVILLVILFFRSKKQQVKETEPMTHITNIYVVVKGDDDGDTKKKVLPINNDRLKVGGSK